MKTANTVSWVAAVAVASTLAIVAPAFAQTNISVGAGANLAGVNVQGGIHNGPNGGVWHGGPMPGMPGMVGGGIFGTVTAVSGDTLTVTGGGHVMHPMPEQGQSQPMMPVAPTSTLYTVNAANAQIYKGSATTTVSVSAIAVGDTVVVQGTVSGTNITATVIRDGFVPMGMPGRKFFGRGASSTPSGTPPNSPIIQGNGEPVIGGAVTVVNGTTITVTNASNVTYTIDAASSTVVKNGTSSVIGNIAVGDDLIVQGVVNGNSVTASSIIDQGAKTSSGGTSSSAPHGIGGVIGVRVGGFFGAIGGFFQHLFGF
jgi:hypothetical protein